ncbi:MAG: alpha/beta hydrolase [Coleofasciculaceae cyanobacterium SM2_1_6]|nr:alpha/beta hydrolase [Coleofasciculaceae cyanobacterium SM2_1_6]
MTLESIAFPPASRKPAAGLVVFLHGYGANCHNLAGMTKFLNLPDYYFLFADAPYAYPYGGAGRMWYNLDQPNPSELPNSQQLLLDWLQSLAETTAIPLEKTILSGFSQGGAMTLDVGLQLPLAGLIVLSGYLHPQPRPVGVGIPDRPSFPTVLLVHGQQDAVVPVAAAHETRNTLSSWGVVVDYHEFSTGHNINSESLELIQNFVITNTQS